MIEIIDRDASGRICKFNIKDKQILTPNIAIVVNPSKQMIPPKELKKFGVDIIITNSYIIKRDEKIREAILKEGLHKFLDFDGPIYTDSGTFQMYSQGIKDINSDEIVDFQKKIGSDIITPVDLFTLPNDSVAEVKRKIKETTMRIKSAREKVEFLNGPIQGSIFPDFRRKASKEVAKTKPDIFSIGGIVPLMEQYRFKELCDVIIACKTVLPTNTPVHAFGAGHPMVFSLLTAIGCDLFDSAMYSLAAQRGAYLTVQGTMALDQIREFPCSCPECVSKTPNEVRSMDKKEIENFLTRHNLHVTMSEIRTIRQAIYEENLWELVQQRVRAHPNLLEALKFSLRKYSKYFLSNEKITKQRALKYSGEETAFRPEVVRANDWKKNVKGKKYFKKQLFDKVPRGLCALYPFSQSITEWGTTLSAKPQDIAKATLEYQFGKAIPFKNIKIETSRKTGRLRRMTKGNELVGTFRSSDGLFLPTLYGSSMLKMKKIVVKDKEAVEFIKQGKSVFAKFVDKCDEIYPGEEVVVTDGKVSMAVGRALLNKKEILEADRGLAVKVR